MPTDASYNPQYFNDSVVVNGDLTAANSTGTLGRAILIQDDLKPFAVPLEEWVIFDAVHNRLPSAATSDDLGLITGTYGTAPNSIRSSDAKATTVTQKMRRRVKMPAEYVDGQTVTLRIAAGMKTTKSDGTATVDLSAYEITDAGGLGGSPTDLVSTSATTINSLTAANVDFTIDPAGLAGGDEIDLLVTIAITDAATGTAVLGEIYKTTLLCDIKG